MTTEVTVGELQQYKIFVGTPCYGGMTTGVFAQSTIALAETCLKYGIGLKVHMLYNESLVQRARNYVVDEFLRSDATHLMFIDSDIGYDPMDVIHLLAVLHSNDKVDMVAGPYPKKTIAWEKVQEAALQGKGKEDPKKLSHYAADYVFNTKIGDEMFNINEPVEMSEVGTGFLMIPREVFEKFDEAYPEYRYLPDHGRTANFAGDREITAYFHCSIDPDSRRYLSEDYHFCKKAGEIGISVYLCPWMQMVHMGTYPFTGSMAAMAELGVSPTV